MAFPGFGMASIGIQYSFGRRKPMNAFQRFEVWRNFRRTQVLRAQQATQSFSTAFWQQQQRKAEDASIVAAQAALNRIVNESRSKLTTSMQGQLKQLIDKKV